MTSEKKIKLPINSKGKRATFYNNSEIDNLFSMITILTQELSVSYNRVFTLEKILEKKGILNAKEIESWSPSEEEESERNEITENLLSRVFHMIHEEAESSLKKR